MGCLPQKNMKKVVEDVLVNKLSLRKAAERNCVKYQTLARYVKKSQENPNGTELSFKPRTDTPEKMLIEEQYNQRKRK